MLCYLSVFGIAPVVVFLNAMFASANKIPAIVESQEGSQMKGTLKNPKITFTILQNVFPSSIQLYCSKKAITTTEALNIIVL